MTWYGAYTYIGDYLINGEEASPAPGLGFLGRTWMVSTNAWLSEVGVRYMAAIRTRGLHGDAIEITPSWGEGQPAVNGRWSRDISRGIRVRISGDVWSQRLAAAPGSRHNGRRPHGGRVGHLRPRGRCRQHRPQVGRRPTGTAIQSRHAVLVRRRNLQVVAGLQPAIPDSPVVAGLQARDCVNSPRLPPSSPSKRPATSQGPILVLALIAFVVGGGTLGYMFIEGWGAWDAFYMTVITITTVGYREVHDLSRTGQAFTVVLLIIGVGTALYAFGLSASVIVEGGLQARFKRRKYTRMLDALTDHYIICGYGRIGTIIVDELRRQNIPYVVIDRDAERVHTVMEMGGLAVEADASREEVLTRVGIAHAKGLIAAVSTDAENVYAILTARGLRPDLFIVGRAETPDAVRKLKRAGANRVVSPYKIGAVQNGANRASGPPSSISSSSRPDRRPILGWINS